MIGEINFVSDARTFFFHRVNNEITKHILFSLIINDSMLFVCLFVFYFVFQLTNKDITDSIDAEMDGDLQKAFMTLGGRNIFVIQYF